MPLIGAPDPAVPPPRSERKRRVVWFAVAVALHAALLLGIWLMPPLRLKWSPSPEDWVQVVSLPQKAPDVVAPETTALPAVPKAGTAPKAKGRKPVGTAPPPETGHQTEGQTAP